MMQLTPRSDDRKFTEPDWQTIRGSFPTLANIVYLNTAGGCAMPIAVGEAGKLYYEESVNEGDMCWGRWLERTEAVRAKVARTLGAAPDDIAFLGNASLGMNFAQQMLEAKRGVLLVENDFPSVTLPWVKSSENVKFLSPAADGSVSIESIANALNEGVEVLALSHIQYSSGFTFELEQISKLCRDRGVTLIVDATQSFGAREIDLRTTPVDVLIFSGYKWSMAGYGIGATYLSPEFRSRYQIPSVGWRSAAVPYKMLFDEVTVSGSAKDLELGHPPFAAIFALGAAIDFTSEVGISRIGQRIRELTLYLHERAKEVGIAVASTQTPANMSGITMLNIQNPDEVVTKLKERGVFVSVRNGLVRVSVHFYNAQSDIDALISELSR